MTGEEPQFLKVISSARVRVNARKGCSLNVAVLVRGAARARFRAEVDAADADFTARAWMQRANPSQALVCLQKGDDEAPGGRRCEGLAGPHPPTVMSCVRPKLIDDARKVPEGHKVRARPRVEVRKGAPKSTVLVRAASPAG